MSNKGQIEVIALFGIIFVVVIVLVYAFQSGMLNLSPVPAGVAEKQKEVKSSIENFVRLGSKDIIANMSLYGGYLSEEEFTSDVEFNGRPVAYWQHNGVTTRPQNIQNKFMTALTDYVKGNIDTIMENLDVNATYDASLVSVSGSILADNIIVHVYLPVYVEDYLIPQPIEVVVPTKFGKILDLAGAYQGGLLDFMNVNRPFEYFTLSSMIVSPIEDNQPSVPFYIVLMNCGESYVKSSFQIMPQVETMIKKTLSNTFMPGKVPENTLDVSSSVKYVLPRINNNAYSDLKVSFHVPDDFELTTQNFQMDPTTVVSYARNIYMTSVCMSDPVYINYYIKYPMVVRITDPDTRNTFHFAYDVYINENGPGSWTGGGQIDPTLQADICSDNICEASVTVRDTSGSPIMGADVAYMGCYVGKTDDLGFVYGRIPCGAGQLQVFKDGYSLWERGKPYYDIENYEVTLKKLIDVDVVVHEVHLNKRSASYIIDEIRPMPDDRNFRFVYKPIGETYCEGTNTYCDRVLDSAAGEIGNVVVGDHAVSASIVSSDWNKLYGMVVGSYTFTEGQDGKTLHVYIPTSLEFQNLDEGARSDYVNAYMTALQIAGITPITENEITLDGLSTTEVRFDEIGL